jgi:catechol 2,3-dioxygenase-like lactoylglutathione lyase family enzyme
MLEKKKIFGSFSVSDLQKARQFYSQTLGLEVEDHEGMGYFDLHTSGDNHIMVYSRPNHVPAAFTVLNIPCDNITTTVDDLTHKGIKFEHYQGDLKTDERGIHRWENGPVMAWFKDPDGNIVSVGQM